MLHGFSWGCVEKHLFILERAPITDQGNSAIKVQLGKPVSSVRFLTGTQVTQKQLCHWKLHSSTGEQNLGMLLH